MRTLTIEALTPDSARAFHDALSGFQPELRVTDDAKSYVEVAVGPSDFEIVQVLGAIQDHVIERSTGPARIAYNGRRYALHAVPALPAAAD